MHVRSCFLNPALATRQSLLSRDSRAAQRIEVPDHVGDSCFGCPSVGQPAESCLVRRAELGDHVVALVSSLHGPCCLRSTRPLTKRRESHSSNPWASAGRRSQTISSHQNWDQGRSHTTAIAPTSPTTTKAGR